MESQELMGSMIDKVRHNRERLSQGTLPRERLPEAAIEKARLSDVQARSLAASHSKTSGT